ncbi:hypothetical protein VNI00_011112 [Paramarasmius palmivorus]|uniref:Uncharacterized protein n=1 Tax=Paramarasmius palmivorus TaxID=297713 RepID=A0AAW0CBW4_9AGAR
MSLYVVFLVFRVPLILIFLPLVKLFRFFFVFPRISALFVSFYTTPTPVAAALPSTLYLPLQLFIFCSPVTPGSGLPSALYSLLELAVHGPFFCSHVTLGSGTTSSMSLQILLLTRSPPQCFVATFLAFLNGLVIVDILLVLPSFRTFFDTIPLLSFRTHPPPTELPRILFAFDDIIYILMHAYRNVRGLFKPPSCVCHCRQGFLGVALLSSSVSQSFSLSCLGKHLLLVTVATQGFFDVMDQHPACRTESFPDFVRRFRKTSREVFWMIFLQEIKSAPTSGELSSCHFRYIPGSGIPVSRDCYTDWSTYDRQGDDTIDQLISANEAHGNDVGAIVVVVGVYSRDRSSLAEFTTTRGINGLDAFQHGYFLGNADDALARCGGN